jgi:6-phosphogluconolactonase (cycloisomerase 2 family)
MSILANTFCPRWKVGVLCISLGLLAACGGAGSSTSSPPSPTLQSISISPGQATVAAGLTAQFSAKGNFSDGTSTPLNGATWSTSDQTLATVDSQGLVTTHKPGSVTVTAAMGTIANTAPVTVGPPVPLSLAILPASSSVIMASAPTKLSAMLAYSDGSSQDVSATATWSVVNPFTASIDSSGNVTPLRIGYTTIQSTSGSLSASAVFVVFGEPRYLYYMSDGGRVASKAVINSSSGQLRMSGYILTGANTSSGFHCPTTDPAGKFLYVGSLVGSGALTGEIQIYTIDAVAGQLTALAGSPFAQASPVGCLDFEPTGKYAYAANAVNNSTQLLTFSADPTTGALTFLNTVTLPGVPSRVAIDPLGQYLYLAALTNNDQSASALGYSIDASSGALTPLPSTPLALTQYAGTFSFHPSGNYVYLSNTNGSSIDTYSIDRSTGKLTSTGTIATCVNPTTVRFNSDATIAYTGCSMDVAHDPNSASVDSFTVGPNGVLTHLDSTPATDAPSDLIVDPSGQFLYSVNVYPYIDLFQIQAGGSAEFLRRFGTPTNPGMSLVAVGGTAAVKYTPQTAYITSAGDNTFTTYAANADGTLSLSQNIQTTNAYSSLSLWPWGSDIAMSSAIASPNALSYPVVAGGALGPATTFGDAVSAGGVAIDPSGQFAFETDSNQGLVYTYGGGGPWSLVTYATIPPTTAFAAGAGAGPIAIDPSGLLVYVANQTDNTISAYQYWGISAELFESKGQYVLPYTDGSPFAVGASPLALAIDPNESFLYVLSSDQMLRAFSIDYRSGGHLTSVASAPLAGRPASLAVEPNGQFVYTADSTGVSAFSVDPASGSLSPVTVSPAITFANITGVFVDPAGQYLYVTTGSQTVAGAVYGFSIGSNGNLTAVSAQPLATPKLPLSMAFKDEIQ